MQNVITSAFEVATTVQEGVELLDIFEQFNSREVCVLYCVVYMIIAIQNVYMCFFFTQTIKRAIDRKTVDLYQMFIEELNLVKKEFARKNPQRPRSQPRNAGLATWARLLKRRIDAPMNVSVVHHKLTVLCCVYILYRLWRRRSSYINKEWERRPDYNISSWPKHWRNLLAKLLMNGQALLKENP